MQFTMVDGGVALLAVVSGFLAYTRGFTREMFAIGSWIIAALVAFALAPLIEPLIREIPGVGAFLATSCVISMIVSFAIIMAVGLLVLSVFTPLFSAAVQESVLGPIDRALGFLFGLARAAVLVAVGYLIYTEFVLSDGAEIWPPLANAATLQPIDEISQLLFNLLPDQTTLAADGSGAQGGIAGWFGERIDALMAPCGSGVQTAPVDTPPSDTGTGGTGNSIEQLPAPSNN